jgi:hypothetical protein
VLCALVPRAERPKSIPEFVDNWAILSLAEWGVKLDIPADVFITGDSASAHAGLRLLDPEVDGNRQHYAENLAEGDVMPRTVKGATIADRTANSKAIA